ncbi:hypothetical protein EDD85DRAFT_114325 [Armillaria nabsnona]|nr:hypothetical protein EDD85DRAFT_114325 [Armillaria nabsnona]
MVEPINPTRNDIQPMNAPFDHALDHWPRHIHDFRQTSEHFALQLAESRSQAKDTVGTQLKCSAVYAVLLFMFCMPTYRRLERFRISSRSRIFEATRLHCISRTPLYPSTPPLNVGCINQRTVILLSIAREFPGSSSIISCPDTVSLRRRRASKRRKEGESSGKCVVPTRTLQWSHQWIKYVVIYFSFRSFYGLLPVEINKQLIVVQFVVPGSQNADNFLSETT